MAVGHLGPISDGDWPTEYKWGFIRLRRLFEEQSMTTIPVITLETIQASLTEAEILDAVKGALIAQAR